VGYPTETDEDFEKTIELLNETRPDIVNLSRYSQRPGTEAAEMTQIDALEVKKRSKQVSELVNSISLENNKKWIGWEGEVLFDEKLDGQIKGRNFAYKPIFVNDMFEIGQTCVIQIVDATNHSLIGKIAS
jgi:tRNA A37 methylthiotransferase MiaB